MPEITALQFFSSAAEFRTWLEKNYASAREIWVGFHRKDSGRGGITYSEALDELLCFGWIDGVRKRVDESSYANRFTPRKPVSNWSHINLARVAVLEKQGRMTDAGRAALAARQDQRTGVYSFEQTTEPRLTAAETKQFRANAKAWKFFSALAPSYRRVATWWIVSAKQAATRERRLAALIVASAEGKRLR